MSEIITCKIAEIEPIVHDVYYVRLLPSKAIDFKAGQYLNVILCHDEKTKRPFSIASTPFDNDALELHIGATPSNEYTYSVISQMLNKNDINIEVPLGDAWLREESKNPLVLIAGGTGYSYIRSILVTAIARDPKRQIDVFWGGKKPENLYDLDFLTSLSQKYPQVSIHATVEEPDEKWQGEQGLLLDCVAKQHPSLENKDIYIAGRFEMVKIAKTRFIEELNANENHLFSDVFSFI